MSCRCLEPGWFVGDPTPWHMTIFFQPRSLAKQGDNVLVVFVHPSVHQRSRLNRCSLLHLTKLRALTDRRANGRMLPSALSCFDKGVFQDLFNLTDPLTLQNSFETIMRTRKSIVPRLTPSYQNSIVHINQFRVQKNRQTDKHVGLLKKGGMNMLVKMSQELWVHMLRM